MLLVLNCNMVYHDKVHALQMTALLCSFPIWEFPSPSQPYVFITKKQILVSPMVQISHSWSLQMNVKRTTENIATKSFSVHIICFVALIFTDVAFCLVSCLSPCLNRQFEPLFLFLNSSSCGLLEPGERWNNDALWTVLCFLEHWQIQGSQEDHWGETKTIAL